MPDRAQKTIMLLIMVVLVVGLVWFCSGFFFGWDTV